MTDQTQAQADIEALRKLIELASESPFDRQTSGGGHRRNWQDAAIATQARLALSALQCQEEMAQEIEQLRMQLAACGVAAMQNTRNSIAERIDRTNLYWSASYGDICAAVDREVSYREEIERLKADCHTMELESAEAYALVLSHESVIDRLKAELVQAAQKERERCLDILKEITEEWGSGYQLFNEFWTRIVKEKKS